METKEPRYKQDHKKDKYKKKDDRKERFPFAVEQEFQRGDRKQKKHKGKEEKRQRKLYGDYLSLDDIEQSRKDQQNIYYKGRV